jgi:hypothetical protein
MRCGQPAAVSPVPHRLTQPSNDSLAGVTTYPLLSDAETPADTDSARPTRSTSNTWNRVGLVVLLVGTAVMYLWNITVNGMGNQFYAAAAQAGSTNWEALLFGSLDPHNFITVDKPPVSQWVMGLSGQIFGFSSASMLIPQALMAVASVALLYGTVVRVSGPRRRTAPCVRCSRQARSGWRGPVSHWVSRSWPRCSRG